jgi:hypothetical protein
LAIDDINRSALNYLVHTHIQGEFPGGAGFPPSSARLIFKAELSGWLLGIAAEHLDLLCHHVPLVR